MRVRYYEDDRGYNTVQEYLDGLARTGELAPIAQFRRALDLLAEHGPAVGMPHSRMIDRSARLYELRFGDHRVAYGVVGDVIVLLYAWRKRGQKLDAREARRALSRLIELREQQGR